MASRAGDGREKDEPVVRCKLKRHWFEDLLIEIMQLNE